MEAACQAKEPREEGRVRQTNAALLDKLMRLEAEQEDAQQALLWLKVSSGKEETVGVSAGEPGCKAGKWLQPPAGAGKARQKSRDAKTSCRRTCCGYRS